MAKYDHLEPPPPPKLLTPPPAPPPPPPDGLVPPPPPPPPPVAPDGLVPPPPPPPDGLTPPPFKPVAVNDREPQVGDVWVHVLSTRTLARLVIRRWRYKGMDKLQYATVDGQGSCVTSTWRFLHYTPTFQTANNPVNPDMYPLNEANDLTDWSWSDMQELQALDAKNRFELSEIEADEVQRFRVFAKKTRASAMSETLKKLA